MRTAKTKDVLITLSRWLLGITSGAAAFVCTFIVTWLYWPIAGVMCNIISASFNVLIGAVLALNVWFCCDEMHSTLEWWRAHDD